MRAFIDYDEWMLDQFGRPYLGCWTMAEVFVTRNSTLYDLLASIRPNSLAEDWARLRRVDPVWMEWWDPDHPEPIPRLTPKGAPDRLGWGDTKFTLEGLGFALPDSSLYGRTISPPRIVSNTGVAEVYRWPPTEDGDAFGFSWLSARELEEVADRVRAIPTTEAMPLPLEGWGVDPANSKERHAPVG